MTESAGTRCGTFVLAGRPNAGKSTLLNALVGEPLAIVSPKPQSTRMPVVGLRTDQNTQLIFVDLPGLFEPGYLLQRSMIDLAATTLRTADGVLYLHPADAAEPPPLETLLPEGTRVRAPVLTLLTKVDASNRPPVRLSASPPDSVPPIRPSARPPDSLPPVRLSAVTGEGVDTVLAWCRALAPVREFRYDADDISTQPVRFFVSEFVREAAFDLLGDELPYAMAAEVDEFREGAEPVYIRVVVYVERDSQKGMVIGKDGRTIKALGAAARARTEAFLGQRVYLDLWVKTLPKWRSSPSALQRFGFSTSEKRSR